MNKFLALLVAFSLICSSVIPAFASDYEGHWAESVARELLNSGVISGDGNGLRLDDNIKRSEFVKVINNVFNIPDGGMTNFPDVSVDKWYFGEFLKAKNAGYLTGDNNGNANPEANIKRVEAAVILARILGYAPTKTIANFTDDAKIPDWGKEAIYTLASKKIINGYLDGSFNAESNLTRAEAFTLITKTEASGGTDSKKPPTSTADESVSGVLPTGSVSSGNGGSGGGGSSGGGGGGGSSSSAPTLSITWTDEENNTIHWNQVSGASSYTVTVTRKTEGVAAGTATDTTSASSYVLTDLVKGIAPISDRQPLEDVEVTVSTTVGANTLTAITSLRLSYAHVKTPEITVVSEDNNGTEKLYFSWENDTNASAYTFNVNLDNTGFTTLPYTTVSGKCIAEIPSSLYNSLTKTFPYKMQATATDPDTVPLRQYEAEINNLLYASGEGTDSKPYIIKFARHFRNIAENPDADYYLAADITLDQTAASTDNDYYSVIPLFTGNLTGYDVEAGEKAVRTITVNSTNGLGVFEKIENSNIEKIKIAGTATSTENVMYASPFIGTATGTNTITDCENTAELTVKLHGSSDPGMGKAGGILAYNAGVTSFKNCVNSANLEVTNSSTASYLGGICGANSGIGAERPSFTNCGNTGVIKTASSAAAGIIAMPKATTITGCYNVGSISSVGVAGGMVATTTSGATVTISKSYNSGKITSAKAGGILATAQGTSVNIKDSYNSGLINGTTAGKIVAESGAATNTITDCYDSSSSSCNFAASNFTLTNCYYLASATGSAANGLKPLSDTDMKNLSGFGFTADNWTQNLSGAYKYPQIAGTPHIFVAETLDKPVISVNLGRSSSKLIISGSSNAIGYIVTIEGNEFSVTGGGNTEVDITAYVTASGEYTATVIALGDGEMYKDSQVQSLDFTKEAFMFMPAVASVKGNAADEYTASWTINDTQGLSGYIVSVTDKETGTDIITDESVASDKLSYTIDDSDFVPGKEYIFKIKAIGTNSEESTDVYVTKEFKTLYAEGDGSEATPYVIRNERHFKNIPTDTTDSYYLAENITLDQTLSVGAYTPIATFKGKLTGMKSDLSSEEVRTINVTSESGYGLFTSISGATLKNLKLTGSVEGTNYQNVAGFASTATGGRTVTSEFVNCENNATVTNKGPAASLILAAGFIGKNNAVVKFTNCVNSGNIKTPFSNASNMAAGFVGNSDNTSGIKAQFINCRNTADIYGGLYTSGFVGNATDASFEKSFNTGIISTNQYGAGFVASTNSKCSGITIENSYNAGEITNVTSPRYDLVLGGFVTRTDKTVTVTDSYNSGSLTNTSNKQASKEPICNTAGTVTMTNCYYLSDTTGTETNGLTPLSDSDMKIKDNFIGFDWSIWNEPSGTYPTLK